MRLVYLVALSLAWAMVIIAFELPPGDFEMRQGLWLRAILWCGVLSLCTTGVRQTAWWTATARTRTLLLTSTGAVLVAAILDYVITVLMRRNPGPMGGWERDVSTLSFAVVLLAALGALAALRASDRALDATPRCNGKWLRG